jgi:predicted enzyme related to lactoylglutathione lyase
MAQTRTFPSGVTSWIDLQVPDPDAARAFYGPLFGWTFDAPAGAAYAVARLDGQEAAGITGGSGGDPAAWRTYVAVTDLGATVERVEAAGGRVLVGAADAGAGSRSATCADPSGVPFLLLQAGRLPGVQVSNTPGAWNFSDLHAADPATAARFYTDVFGWSFDDLGFATMIRVPGYGDHLAATVDPGIHERQSGPLVPPGFADAIGWLAPVGPDEEPHWHVAFTVADRDETAALAERLGGKILRSTDTAWTREALVRDPLGGEFTASQFTPPSG